MPDKKISNCKICGEQPKAYLRKEADVFHIICGTCGISLDNHVKDKCIDIWNKLNDNNGIRIGDTIEIDGAVYEYKAIQSADEDTPIMMPENKPLSRHEPANCCSVCGSKYGIK